jgi:multimeric flavodoxin WrbA
MKILMLSGSRNPEGQTARAANAILTGVTRAGSDVESIFLPTMEIERCRQCENTGWGLCKEKGRCVIDDDLPTILDKVQAADVVIFANPVYFGDLSESMHAFLARVRRTTRHEAGKARVDGKTAVGVCVAGGSGNNAPECCYILDKFLSKCEFDVVNMIPVRRQNLEAKLPSLEMAGEWLTTKPRSG